MKTPRIYIGALAVFCIAALVIGTSGAAAATRRAPIIISRKGPGSSDLKRYWITLLHRDMMYRLSVLP